MKKTLFLLFCTILITGLLFFSGSYLLDLVAMSDTLTAALFETGDGGDGLGSSDSGMGAKKFSFFNSFDSNSSGEFIDVLRGFRQNADSPVNVLILAGDNGTNTDAIMVMRYNPKDHMINILSIPRDTYITLSGYKFHKINSVYSVKNGVGLLESLIGETFGIKIDYYVHMDMKVVREVVDLLDGVEYDVPCEMIYDDPDQDLHINLKKGTRTLTGKQVEGLLRFRHPNKWTKEVKQYYDGSDLKRIERRHDFFGAMIKQKVNVKYITKIGDVINNVYSNITTDLPLTEMLKLAGGLPGVSRESLHTEMLPGEAKTIDGLSYYIHDAKQSAAIAAELFGDD